MTLIINRGDKKSVFKNSIPKPNIKVVDINSLTNDHYLDQIKNVTIDRHRLSNEKLNEPIHIDIEEVELRFIVNLIK